MAEISRRAFLQASAAGLGPGTALGSLVGLGASLVPATARAQALRIREAKATPTVCPYCSVGCAMIVHTIGNEIVNIEGDKRSPHNEGCLCPKGAATYQLIKNPNRATRVLHRKPGAREWEEVELDWAMDRIARLVKETRDETFQETWTTHDAQGREVRKRVNHTLRIGSLGGATMDNEWNYLQCKLMRALGVVFLENQAR
ncbi:MAG TPA: formate dehydrogenase, partial [Gemmatimonadales bacterium]|nr:formate dehydrogenase [Gemmatimonadales bacterium]